MIKIKYNKYIEYIILLMIFLSSIFVTYNLLLKIPILSHINIVEKNIYTKPKIYIWEKDFNEYINSLNIIKDKSIPIKKTLPKTKNYNIDDFYKLTVNNKDFLLSDDPKSFEYWFISKQITNNILFLYSHNSYKYTENSWYYLYNHLKLNDTLLFNDSIKYTIKKTLLIDINKWEDKNIKIGKNINIIYFTCTPYWDNIRKVFLLSKKEEK